MLQDVLDACGLFAFYRIFALHLALWPAIGGLLSTLLVGKFVAAALAACLLLLGIVGGRLPVNPFLIVLLTLAALIALWLLAALAVVLVVLPLTVPSLFLLRRSSLPVCLLFVMGSILFIIATLRPTVVLLAVLVSRAVAVIAAATFGRCFGRTA